MFEEELISSGFRLCLDRLETLLQNCAPYVAAYLGLVPDNADYKGLSSSNLQKCM